MEIEVKDLDHLGIVAGIIDQIGLVEEIDQVVSNHPQQKVSTGQVIDDVAVETHRHYRQAGRRE